jgi:lipopolysaccharide transport system ATP-binding protein
MKQVVISVEHLSKSYRLGIINHGMLYKDLQSWWARFRGREDPNAKIHPYDDGINIDAGGHFWALNDISFDVEQGEVLGIVGRNGAGKSTLLKILSRVTAPTKGIVKIRGRIASLLEVGTGFHQELTGRENIFLNGAILGMSKPEIHKKLDEIISFAEMEKFIDTPVKRYSSGMYVRLAFAVAAHLDPEILIIDEVLAVGDADFQKKCLGKMDEVAKNQGRTVLFVSHNMGAVNTLCSKALIINKGKLLAHGNTRNIIDQYLSINRSFSKNGKITDPAIRSPLSNKKSLFKWTEIQLINSCGEYTGEIKYREPFELVIKGYAERECTRVLIGVGVVSKLMGIVFVTHQLYNGLPDIMPAGWSEFRITFDANLIAPGIYDIEICAEGTDIMDHIPQCTELHVLDVGISSDIVWDKRYQNGLIYYPCKWEMKSF